MKTAIVYYSQHHGNTKKLLDAICDADMSVTLINATEKKEVDLREYDRIGIANLGFPEALGDELVKNLGSPKAMDRMTFI